MRAQDLAGNQEAYPGSAEATTLVPAANVLCAAPDSYESDNDAGSASSLAVGGAQAHNFCKATTYINDEDWISVTLTAGTEYLILIDALHPDTALDITLFAADGTTPVLQPGPAAYDHSVVMPFIPSTSGTYYLRVAHDDGRIIGSAVQYSVKIFEPIKTVLPLIFR
jgi:hypothetical protein